MNNVVHDMVVVDASIALKWVLLEKDSNVSMSLLDKWTRERKRIIAPALFVYEITNIIYREVTQQLIRSAFHEKNYRLHVPHA